MSDPAWTQFGNPGGAETSPSNTASAKGLHTAGTRVCVIGRVPCLHVSPPSWGPGRGREHQPAACALMNIQLGGEALVSCGEGVRSAGWQKGDRWPDRHLRRGLWDTCWGRACCVPGRPGVLGPVLTSPMQTPALLPPRPARHPWPLPTLPPPRHLPSLSPPPVLTAYDLPAEWQWPLPRPTSFLPRLAPPRGSGLGIVLRTPVFPPCSPTLVLLGGARTEAPPTLLGGPSARGVLGSFPEKHTLHGHQPVGVKAAQDEGSNVGTS